MDGEPKESEKRLAETLESMTGVQLGTLAFNLSALAWIGLNISFDGLSPRYMPCSYLNPNFLNLFCACILIYSSFLAGAAIKRRNVIPAFMVFSFVWSMVASIFRHFAE